MGKGAVWRKQPLLGCGPMFVGPLRHPSGEGRQVGAIRSFPVLRSVGQGREASGSCEQADLYHALLWPL